MGRKLSEVLKTLPVERRIKIEILAQKKIEELILHAQTLADFRRAVGKTQVQVAESLGIKQHAVSQLEKRSDTYVSTLRKFLESLGMKLELSVITERGIKIELPNFHPWEQEPIPRIIKPKRATVKKIAVTVKKRRNAANYHAR